MTAPHGHRPPGVARRRRSALIALALLVAATALASPAQAASSKACEGGGYQLVDAATGAVVADGRGDRRVRTTIPAASLGDRFIVRGVHQQFAVRAGDFAVFDHLFTGAANRERMVTAPTVVWESKVPDHRGLTLSSAITVQFDREAIELGRTGAGLSMKIQSKDCAQGGIFQMEPERGDGTRTRIVHTLGGQSFYFDNPLFRARIGQFLGSTCTSVEAGPPGQFCVQVSARVNIASDSPAARDLVARDSAQVATRIDQPACRAVDPALPPIPHCGRQSIWDVASGGRMGFVTGEDAVEVANPPTTCTQDCQAQNQVRGRLAVLGFPSPVPQSSRLTPPTAPFDSAPLTAP
ncbi:hypothetical protein ACI78Q_22475 [Geodermatophilus sp. SYSU D00705]